MKRIVVAFAAALIAVSSSGHKTVIGAAPTNRVSFVIRVSAPGTNEAVLTEAVIDGPEGTDFDIDLNTEGFEFASEFLTDPVGDSEVQFRVRLNTRRLFGTSPNGLPLYEVDEQEHSIKASFTEAVVLLPFGRNGKGPTLRIEILPEKHAGANTEAGNRLDIDFRKNLTAGEVSVDARKVPHNYEARAQILVGKEAVAGSTAGLLFRQAGRIDLLPEALVLDMEVEDFTRSRPADLVTVTYSLKRKDGSIVASGRAITSPGSNVVVPLESKLGEGRELRFSLKELEIE